MADRPVAQIVTYCQHCGLRMGVHTDKAGEGTRWEPPNVGGPIDLDTITKVEGPLAGRGLPCYVVWLDTKRMPHCDKARSAT